MAKTILIIEDEVSVWLSLEGQIQQSNLDVEIERLDGTREGIDAYLAGEWHADLAIIDLQLPRVNGIDPDGGFEALERISVRNVELPVIVLTGRDDREACDLAGTFQSVRYFVIKPWDSVKLLEAIRLCLSGEAAGLKVCGELER